MKSQTRVRLGVSMSVGGLLLSLSSGLFFVYLGIQDLQQNKTTSGLLKLLLWPELIALVCILGLIAPGMRLLRSVRPSTPTNPAPPVEGEEHTTP